MKKTLQERKAEALKAYDEAGKAWYEAGKAYRAILREIEEGGK